MCMGSFLLVNMVVSESGYDLGGGDNLFNILSCVNFGFDCNSVFSVIFDGFFIDLFCCDNFDEGEEFV